MLEMKEWDGFEGRDPAIRTGMCAEWTCALHKNALGCSRVEYRVRRCRNWHFLAFCYFIFIFCFPHFSACAKGDSKL